MPSTDPSDSSNHSVVHIMLAVGLGSALGFAYIVGDWISAGFVFFVMVTAYYGYWSGVIKIASGLIGLLAAIQFARPCSSFVAKYTDQLFNASDRLLEPINLGIAGILVAIVVILTLRITAHYVFQSKPHWKGIDRWLGAGFGAIQGIVVTAIILMGIVMLEPMAKQLLAQSNGARSGFPNQLFAKVVSFREQCRHSSIGRIMDTMDPIQDRFNKRLQKMTDVISTNKPADEPFQQMLRQAVQKFQDDPEAQKILSSRGGIDETTLRSMFESSELEDALH